MNVARKGVRYATCHLYLLAKNSDNEWVWHERTNKKNYELTFLSCSKREMIISDERKYTLEGLNSTFMPKFIFIEKENSNVKSFRVDDRADLLRAFGMGTKEK
jgi:hypothetical protein